MSKPVHVFNQYYWDFLKKVKDIARDQKYKGDDTNARNVLREIKRSYLSFDRTSEEHVEHFRKCIVPAWASFAEDKVTMEAWDDWYTDATICNLEVYKGITVDMILSLFRTKDTVLYYFMLFSIFSDESLTDEQCSAVLQVLRKNVGVTDAEFANIDNAKIQAIVRLMHLIASQSHREDNQEPNIMSELEKTSLGKLAKEIMDEVNVDEIQKSIGDDGDIMKAFADPNAGFSKLIGTVSQKMMSKIASGELTQDTLLSEAMKLTQILPGFGGGASKGGSGASMGSMMSQMANLFGGGGDIDISSVMKTMMGGGAPKGSKATINQAAVNRTAKAKQLRRKLEQRRKTKENIETHVGNE